MNFMDFEFNRNRVFFYIYEREHMSGYISWELRLNLKIKKIKKKPTLIEKYNSHYHKFL